MDDHNDEVPERPHFGSYLKEYRLKNNISVESVCDETKLSRYMVVSIEANDRNALPEDVLLKSFLRNFAAVCGADGDTVVSLYLEAYPPKEEGSSFSRSKKRNMGLLFLTLCLIVFVTGGLAFFFKFS